MKDQKGLHDMLAYAGPNRNRLSPMSYVQEKLQTTSPTEIMAILVDAILELSEKGQNEFVRYLPGDTGTRDLGESLAAPAEAGGTTNGIPQLQAVAKRKRGRPKKTVVI